MTTSPTNSQRAWTIRDVSNGLWPGVLRPELLLGCGLNLVALEERVFGISQGGLPRRHLTPVK